MANFQFQLIIIFKNGEKKYFDLPTSVISVAIGKRLSSSSNARMPTGFYIKKMINYYLALKNTLELRITLKMCHGDQYQDLSTLKITAWPRIRRLTLPNKSKN